MAVASIVLAISLIDAVSAGRDRWLDQWPRLFGAGTEGARQLLSTLAGSMMTVMSITFSMTLVALALASSQYTPRILRNFVRSQVTQCTLGTIAALNAAYNIGSYRTVDQDAAFGTRQIAAVALKALSPAFNDTSTGVICVATELTAHCEHS